MNAPRESWPRLDPVASKSTVAPSGSATPKSTRQSVVEVRRWTDTLISIRVTRDPAFRFTAGHYARLGLVGADGIAVTRPLSIASAASDPHLDFVCTLVPGGEFSSLLAACTAGDAACVDRASYGFLTIAGLAPGPDLWLLASGTGIAPFLSILREPFVWSSFERIVVVHSVRFAAELAPAAPIAERAREAAAAPGSARLTFLPVVTREPGATTLASRIPALLATGRLEESAGVPIDVAASRVMTCGNPAMARDVRRLLSTRGFAPVRRNAPGQMIFENYWQDRPALVPSPSTLP